MKKKKLIWFLGSNATGKTTQAKLLHTYFSGNGNKLYVEYDCGFPVVIKATMYDKSGHVGFLKDNQCTGTDTINNRESIDATYCYLLDAELIDYIIVDGIMATAKWIDIFNQFPQHVDICVILLQFPTLEQNLRRVAERRVFKQIEAGGNDGADIVDFENLVEYEIQSFQDKTLKNVGSKFKGFKSMFDKVKGECKLSFEIDASLQEDQIHKNILKHIKQL